MKDPINPAAEVREQNPEMQLRFFFDQYDVDRHNLTEKQNQLKDLFRGTKGWETAAQEKADAEAKLRTIKEKVRLANQALLNEIDVLDGSVKAKERTMSELAGDVFRRKGVVAFENGMGVKMTAVPTFRFKAASEKAEESADDSDEKE